VDVLSGVSLDWLKALTWISAIAVGLLTVFLNRRRFDLAALRSVLVFAVASAGAGVYVLNHVGDSRWGSKAEDRLNAPALTETPMVGQFLEPLDSFLGGVVGTVNQVVDFQAALPVAMEFFVAAGWALAASLPLGLASLVGGYLEAKRRHREFCRYKLRVDDLTEELEDIKRHLGYAARAEHAGLG
jgi:hypothetical protein